MVCIICTHQNKYLIFFASKSDLTFWGKALISDSDKYVDIPLKGNYMYIRNKKSRKEKNIKIGQKHILHTLKWESTILSPFFQIVQTIQFQYHALFSTKKQQIQCNEICQLKQKLLQTRGSAHWACIAHLTIEWYRSKFQREIIITLKNSSHLEWRVGLSDTILKGTHPGTIYARFGPYIDASCQVWLHLAKLFQRIFLTLANQKKELILVAMFDGRMEPNGTKWRSFIEDQRILHRCFLPSLAPFCQAVSEEKIF